MEKFIYIKKFISSLVSLFFIFSFLHVNSQTPTPVETFVDKKSEILTSLNALNTNDLQSVVGELNNIRSRIDIFVESSIKQCQQYQDKSQNIECFNQKKEAIKQIWTQYFSIKENYLKKLNEKFLEENSNQLKRTLENIDALQISKSKRN